MYIYTYIKRKREGRGKKWDKNRKRMIETTEEILEDNRQN